MPFVVRFQWDLKSKFGYVRIPALVSALEISMGRAVVG